MFQKHVLGLLFVLGAIEARGVDATGGIIDWKGNVTMGKDDGVTTTKVVGPELIFSAAFMRVDTARRYVFRGMFKSANTQPMLVYCGLAQYDGDREIITSTMVAPVPDSATTLLKVAKFGDRVVRVKAARSWIEAMASSQLVIAFDVDDSGGYRDLPNRKLSSRITKLTENDGVWEAVLEKPLDFAVSAGVKVRAHVEGGFMMHVFAIRKELGAWTSMSGVIKPAMKIGAPNLMFWRGTKFVKIVMSCNRGTGYEEAILVCKDVFFGAVPEQIPEGVRKPQEDKRQLVTLDFFPLRVGSELSVDILLPPILKDERPKATLFLTMADIDAPEEVGISVNGKGPLPVPDDVVDDSLRRSGELDLPLEWLKAGKNRVTFRFADDLEGSTGGFIVHDVKILVKY